MSNERSEPLRSLERAMLDNKKPIVTKWFDRILETYPPDARKFFRSQENAIANPVGSSILRGMEGVYDCLVRGVDLESEEIGSHLDSIIRIRAVQEFSPAVAVGFVLDLKGIIRETLGKAANQGRAHDDLLTIESRVDKLALLAFNIYVQCVEKIYDLRAREFKNRTARILQRACQVWEARGEPLPEELRQE